MAESRAKETKGAKFKFMGGFLLSKMARGGAEKLREKADEVNKLNVFPVPDGDTGDNMSLTIDSGVRAIEELDTDNLAETMKAFSHGMLLGARGNSGVILSQLFSGVSKGLNGVKRADAQTLGRALELGVRQAYTSVTTPIEGTILTVAREAVEYAVGRLNSKSTIRTLFADLVKEMNSSLARTPNLLRALKEADVVDSGGAGLLYIMDGFNRVLNGKSREAFGGTSVNLKDLTPKFSVLGNLSDNFLGYCTEALVSLKENEISECEEKLGSLKSYLSELGDSLIVFCEDELLKVHVHTKKPESVIERLHSYGEFITLKIENMSIQHSDSYSYEKRKKNGLVAVCSGEGFEAVFRELGADRIISGGQANNPSTQDFLDAFDAIGAENIFVLPNNSNIIMVAEQAAQLYTKAFVFVIPSKNVGMGYAALSSYNEDVTDAGKILENMKQSMTGICSGYVSWAVKSAEICGFHIAKGDIMGIIDKEIVSVSDNISDAVLGLVERLLSDEDRFMLTVFYGCEVSEADLSILKNEIQERYPKIEIYSVHGGQRVYPYIFVAE